MTIISVMITSPISPLTSVLPLSFVILVTACKQGYEDYNRYMADKRVNRTLVKVIRNKCVQVSTSELTNVFEGNCINIVDVIE